MADEVLLHASYVLLIVSMAMRRISLLRLFVIGSGLVAIYYRLFIQYEFASLVWQALLVGVNVLQLAILWADRFRPPLSDDAEYFMAQVLPSVHRAMARRLVTSGTVRKADAGAVLTREGAPVPALMFVLDGTAKVEVDGNAVARCGRGDFFGEMSFITGEAASADVVAASPLRYLSFERARLETLLATRPELRNALEASFNRNLIAKLARTNAARAGSARPVRG